MMEYEEIDSIKKLIDRGYSDYKIGKKLGHSPNTIKKYRKELNKTQVNQKPEEIVHFENPIPKLKGIVGEIDKIISSQKMQSGDQKEWQKRLESLQEILTAHYDLISEATDKAIEKRDEQWTDLLNQEYVKKEVVIDLNRRIEEMESTIINLRNENEDKDDLITKNQQEISWINASNEREKETLNNRIRDLFWQKADLEEKIWDINDYIGNYLDDAGRWERENLRHEKTDFDRHVQIRQSVLDNMYFEADKKLKAVEKREEEVAKREENIKKHLDELHTSWTSMSEIKNNLEMWQDDIDNQRENIKKRWETVLKTAEELRTERQRLQEWQTRLNKTGVFNKFSLPCPSCRKPMLFDVTNQETNQKLSKIFGNYMHSECKTKSEQVRHVTLRPVLFSGEPVVQSGFSPIIQSVGETKVAESGGGPVLQSGYSPYYYFGTENLNNKT